MSKSILKKTSDKVEHSVKTNRTLFFNEEIDVVEEDEVVPDSLEEFEKLGMIFSIIKIYNNHESSLVKV